ncbi:MAG: acyltransferase [Clostridia bacterium]|nr:acyltransferase [Clostridia bacterium]
MQWKAKLMKPFDLYEISRIRPYLMGIATLWITFYHSKYLNLFNSAFLTKTRLLGLFTRIESIGNCGVDLFFFLSGLGLYFSYARLQEEDPHPLKSFYQRRYGKILLPILLVTVVTFGLIQVDDLANWAGGVFLYGYFLPNLTRGNFWYLSAILVFYLFYPLLHRFLQGRREGLRAAGLIAAAVGAALLVRAAAKEYFYTHAILFMARLPVFILGAWAGKLCYRHQKVPMIVPLLAVPINLLLLVLIADRPLPDFPKFYEYAVFVPCIVLSHAYVFSKFRKRGFLTRSVAVIGTYSMEIYLIYESIYNHAGSLFHQMESTGLVYALTVFTATLVLAVLLRMVTDQLTRVYRAQK